MGLDGSGLVNLYEEESTQRDVDNLSSMANAMGLGGGLFSSFGNKLAQVNKLDNGNNYYQ